MSRDHQVAFLGHGMVISAANNPEALRSRADALLRERRYLEAIPAYRELLAVAPHFAAGWYNLAYLQQIAGHFPDAVAGYERAIELGIDRPEDAWRNKALILAEQLARPYEAEGALRHALRCNDRFVAAWVDLGRIAEQTGRRDEARTAYASALHVDPSHALALSHLANVTKVGSKDDPILIRLRDAVADPTRPAADLAALGFALGKLLDEVGAYDEAFIAYSRANQASRATAGPGWAGYERAVWEKWAKNIPEWFRGKISGTPALIPEIPDEPSLVFICGMFRSGSTLVETILSNHPSITAAGELDLIPRIVRDLWSRVSAGKNPQDPRRLAEAREYYIRSVRALHPNARIITDKRPDNFLHIGLIRQLFPSAKIIHTVRDPLDTCLSVYFTHFDLSQTYATELHDIAHWYALYERLMLNWKEQYGHNILDVHYEMLVADPREQVTKILDFIGLNWDDACIDFHRANRSVQTPSVWQVRQPLYSSSCGRWRNYRTHIEPLVRALRMSGK
jgi:tetratricopeptide (TPR) repeat protein